MIKVSLVSLVVLAGCGSKATPRPTPSNDKGETPTAIAVPAASCEGVAKLLIKERGFGAIPKASHEAARRGGEAQVVAACTDDQWSTEVLSCMASRPSPASCLGQLDPYQQRSYEMQLENWEPKWVRGGMGGSKYGGGDDPCGGGGDPCGFGYGGGAGGQPREEWISCEDSLGDVVSFDPAIKANAPDHDLAVDIRRSAVMRACDLTWSNDDKKCFGVAKDAGSVAACRTKLAEPSKHALGNILIESQARLAQLTSLKKNAKAIECKAVTVAHYNDDQVRGKVLSLAPAERKRVIAESKEKMAATCTSEKWPAAQRACMVLARGRTLELGECFPGNDKYTMMYKWGIPGPGVMFKTGILECDELGDLVKKIATCTSIEADLRQSLLDSLGSQLAMYLDVPASSRLEVGKRCKETQDIYRQGAKERGCSI